MWGLCSILHSTSLMGLEILEGCGDHPPSSSLYMNKQKCYISIKLCTLFSFTEGWLRSFSRCHLVTFSANICNICNSIFFGEKKKNPRSFKNDHFKVIQRARLNQQIIREAGTLFDLTTNWLWFISKDQLISLSTERFSSKVTEKNILTGLSNTIHRSFYHAWRE